MSEDVVQLHPATAVDEHGGLGEVAFPCGRHDGLRYLRGRRASLAMRVNVEAHRVYLAASLCGSLVREEAVDRDVRVLPPRRGVAAQARGCVRPLGPTALDLLHGRGHDVAG